MEFAGQNEFFDTLTPELDNQLFTPQDWLLIFRSVKKFVISQFQLHILKLVASIPTQQKLD